MSDAFSHHFGDRRGAQRYALWWWTVPRPTDEAQSWLPEFLDEQWTAGYTHVALLWSNGAHHLACFAPRHPERGHATRPVTEQAAQWLDDSWPAELRRENDAWLLIPPGYEKHPHPKPPTTSTEQG